MAFRSIEEGEKDTWNSKWSCQNVPVLELIGGTAGLLLTIIIIGKISNQYSNKDEFFKGAFLEGALLERSVFRGGSFRGISFRGVVFRGRRKYSRALFSCLLLWKTGYLEKRYKINKR